MDRRLLLQTLALSASGLWLPFSPAQAAAGCRVTDVRLWNAPDHTRIVLELDRPSVAHNLTRLSDPERLVLELRDAEWDTLLNRDLLTDTVVRDMRLTTVRPGVIRAVMELKNDVRPRSFMMKATGNKGDRLIVDLFRREATEAQQEERNSRTRSRRNSEVTVVIDPGHGGEDPGAIGPQGTLEKDIVFSVARKLANRINSMPGYQAHLTRKGDYFVSLHQRVAIARRHHPDLFMSLHADAFHIQSARGASVYCLSERGKPSPDRAIRNLVSRENSSDLIGGINLDQDVAPDVAELLMDLSQRHSINRSLVLGQKLLGSLGNIPTMRLHYRHVKQASFAVLKAPDVPSVLVELAFMTNPSEETLLRKPSHQESLADALCDGTRGYIHLTRRV
ncbi:MAG: N-acetylmuramoyl-L-alanine amidase [Magnetococcales bacterium]|nr:N-acetylmuramoyl-L-alanine amidase [Magnetococcales bacterium]